MRWPQIVVILLITALVFQETLAFCAETNPLERDFTDQQAFPEPTGTITLSDAISAALPTHPDIAAAFHAIKAKESVALQEGLPVNPIFITELEEFGGSGDFSGTDVMGTTIGISQEILMAGKREKKIQIAEIETDLARLEMQKKIIQVRSEVKKRFLRVQFLEKGLLLEQDNLRLLLDAGKAIEKQVALGEISPIDGQRAAIELALGQAALSRARRELQTARLDLASSWGSATPLFTDVKHINTAKLPKGDKDSLWQAMLSSPFMEINRRLINQREASLNLAEALAYPDIEIEGGIKYFNESNDHTYFLGMSIPIPLFDRNQGGIQEARQNIHTAKKQEQSHSLRMRTELANLLQRIIGVDTELETVRETVLPAAEQIYSSLSMAYQEGEKDYLELLDAQRTLLDVRRDNHLLEFEHHELIAELEEMTGMPLITAADGAN